MSKAPGSSLLSDLSTVYFLFKVESTAVTWHWTGTAIGDDKRYFIHYLIVRTCYWTHRKLVIKLWENWHHRISPARPTTNRKYIIYKKKTVVQHRGVNNLPICIFRSGCHGGTLCSNLCGTKDMRGWHSCEKLGLTPWQSQILGLYSQIITQFGSI